MKLSPKATWFIFILVAGLLGGWFFRVIEERNERWHQAIKQHMTQNHCRRAYAINHDEWVYNCNGEFYVYDDFSIPLRPDAHWF